MRDDENVLSKVCVWETKWTQGTLNCLVHKTSREVRLYVLHFAHISVVLTNFCFYHHKMPESQMTDEGEIRDNDLVYFLLAIPPAWFIVPSYLGLCHTLLEGLSGFVQFAKEMTITQLFFGVSGTQNRKDQNFLPSTFSVIAILRYPTFPYCFYYIAILQLSHFREIFTIFLANSDRM